MLKIKPEQFKEFMSDYNKDIVSGLVSYFPDILIEETDDIEVFIKRVIECSFKSGLFNDVFISNTDSIHVLPDDIQLLCRKILLSFDYITLREPVYEKFMSISPQGEFIPFTSEVPQVCIGWRFASGHFTCHVKFPDGQEDILNTWTIK